MVVSYVLGFCWKLDVPFNPLHHRTGWGCMKILEEGEPDQLTQTVRRHTTWHCAQHIKRGKEGGKGDIQSDGVCLPKLCDRALLS